MKTAIIDSSSVILLCRSGMLERLTEHCNAVIPEAVFAELTIPGYFGSEIISGLCETGRIKVCKAFTESSLKHLHAGEREVIDIFLQGSGDYIIIDDGKGAAWCRDNSLPYVNALLAVKILFLEKIIHETEFRTAWRWLVENGRYSEKIILWAERAGRERLAFFI